MISAVFKTGWIELKRGKVELLLTFVVPIVFFSIFAMIFGNQGGSSTPKFNVAFVDLDQTPTSKRFVAALADEVAFRVKGGAKEAPLWSLEEAQQKVRDGKIDVAVVLEKGFAERVPAFATQEKAARIISDGSNPMAPPVVLGMMQKNVSAVLQDRMLVGGAEQMSRFLGPLTEEQTRNLEGITRMIRAGQSSSNDSAAAEGGFGGSPILVDEVKLISEEKKLSMVAYYAAAIAVMFLLFSATGAGGTLIDEMDHGTLERALTSQLGMGRLLLGKWLFLLTMGVVQVLIMFLWGEFVLGGINLFENFAAVIAMTVVTAAAASGFGLVLACLCSSRAQLSGVSTIVILTMSALGGSMFPRFLMSESMQTVGSFTFNGWAVDGFQGIFWRGHGISGIAVELGVIAAMAITFFALARVFARRWEAQ